jgi:hypothetical protein
MIAIQWSLTPGVSANDQLALESQSLVRIQVSGANQLIFN